MNREELLMLKEELYNKKYVSVDLGQGNFKLSAKSMTSSEIKKLDETDSIVEYIEDVFQNIVTDSTNEGMDVVRIGCKIEVAPFCSEEICEYANMNINDKKIDYIKDNNNLSINNKYVWLMVNDYYVKDNNLIERKINSSKTLGVVNWNKFIERLNSLNYFFLKEIDSDGININSFIDLLNKKSSCIGEVTVQLIKNKTKKK